MAEKLSPPSQVIQGDCLTVLPALPVACADLVLSSPPYYNARDYAQWQTYADYLAFMEKVIQQCGRVLMEGRFCVFVVSPSIVARTSRQTASQRYAIPFDLHRLFVESGFDFVDDIVWVKPAPSVAGRGRIFQRKRKPLQYRPNPVTEYVLVYRKHTDKLIDWHLRRVPEQVMEDSLIHGDIEMTNVWHISPATHPKHPAVFPVSLAERLIRLYSFFGETVLDPFGGIGTTGHAAQHTGRDFILVEQAESYAHWAHQNLFGNTAYMAQPRLL